MQPVVSLVDVRREYVIGDQITVALDEINHDESDWLPGSTIIGDSQSCRQ